MHFFILMIGVFISGGCATERMYDPLYAGSAQTILLNESPLRAVKEGMSIDDVHDVMGQKITIGYVGNNLDQGNRSKLAADAVVQPLANAYQPLTIPNPYKSEEINIGLKVYVIEYYVTSVRQPDGVISDNELIPLVFKDGQLIGRGWNFLQSLRSKN